NAYFIHTNVGYGLTALVPSVYSAGCSNIACGTAQLDDAKKIAAQADATVVITESWDRVDLHLPGQQPLLVSEIAKVSKGPVILVIMSEGSMDIAFVGFPGEAGGAAIADVIFGAYNPRKLANSVLLIGGRLPMTWYPQAFADKVPMTNMTGYPGRSYRFYTGDVVYAFGDGLSYTTFHHRLVRAPKLVSIPLEEKHICHSSDCKSIDVLSESICQNLVIDIHLRVKNGGRMSGSHTVLMFSTPPGVHSSPVKKLLGFEKVFLESQMVHTVKFKFDVCKDFSVFDELGNKKVGLGEHILHVGNF
ncbi:hypothetical protein MKW94_030051, partial [Papaver nudicaule]|nr:hypothetical protein [Papaver nudicaule]